MLVPRCEPDKEARSRFWILCKKHDTNNDGKLSRSELKSLFRELYSCLPGIRSRRTLDQFASNENDYVDFVKDFEALFLYLKRIRFQPHYRLADKYSQEQLSNVFKMHDINKDDILSRKELESAFQELDSQFPRSIIEEALREVDANSDGGIHFDQLDALVSYLRKVKI